MPRSQQRQNITEQLNQVRTHASSSSTGSTAVLPFTEEPASPADSWGTVVINFAQTLYGNAIWGSEQLAEYAAEGTVSIGYMLFTAIKEIGRMLFIAISVCAIVAFWPLIALIWILVFIVKNWDNGSSRVALKLLSFTNLFVTEIVISTGTHSIVVFALSFNSLTKAFRCGFTLWSFQIRNNNYANNMFSYGLRQPETIGLLVESTFSISTSIGIFLVALGRLIEGTTEGTRVRYPTLVLIVGCLDLATNILFFCLSEHLRCKHYQKPQNSSSTATQCSCQLHDQDLQFNSARAFGNNFIRPSSPLQPFLGTRDDDDGEQDRRLPTSRNDDGSLQDDTVLSEPSCHCGHHHSRRVSSFEGKCPGGSRCLNDSAVVSLSAVISATVAICLKGGVWPAVIDPVVSIAIGGIILTSAVPRLQSASRVLLQRVPHSLNVDNIQKDICDLPGVLSAHHLHVWKLSDYAFVASLHVTVNFGINHDRERLMNLYLEIRKCLHTYGIHESTIQPEFALFPDGEKDGQDDDGTERTCDPGPYLSSSPPLFLTFTA